MLMETNIHETQGRPNLRWESDIRNDLKEMEVNNWRICMQDINKWKFRIKEIIIWQLLGYKDMSAFLIIKNVCL